MVVGKDNGDQPVTQLLARHEAGDPKAMGALFPLIYGELRRIAGGFFRREGAGQTLDATGLVHEAYFKLVEQRVATWQNRAHFFGIAAQIMRRILCDRARARFAGKRGGHANRLTLSAADQVSNDQPVELVDLVELDDALTRLAEQSERQARIVEMRYFAGLSVEEVAEALGTSPATVKREWTFARTWLKRQMTGG